MRMVRLMCDIMINDRVPSKKFRDRLQLNDIISVVQQIRSHPEMVGDMSRVTLNFDLSKIPFVRFWSR